MRLLVWIDHVDGVPRRASLELLGAAAALAPVEVVAVVLGGAESVAAAVAAVAPRTIHLNDLPQESHERRTDHLAALADELAIDAILLPGHRAGTAIAGRLSVRWGAALLEEVTALTRHADAVEAERFAYLSRASLRVRAASGRVVVTVKAGAFDPPAAAVGGVIERRAAGSSTPDRVTRGARYAAPRGRVALEEARIVVCGGRGVGDAAGFERLVVALADDLRAGVAATRAVVDAGWRPYDEQVGQTGKSVSPALYVAVAVSGAVQHVSGMNRSQVIVVINKDGDAPLFQIADYGVVGDVHRVVPALRAAIASLDPV